MPWSAFNFILIIVVPSWSEFPDAAVQKLQLLQNSAACLLSKTGRYEHIIPITYLKPWYKIYFKIIILTYKLLHELAPLFIHNMLKIYHPTKIPKSPGSNLLLTLQVRFKTFSHRSFQYAASTLWKLRHCQSNEITHSYPNKVQFQLLVLQLNISRL